MRGFDEKKKPPLKVLRGLNGQMEVYSNRVVIRWTGLVSKVFRADKTSTFYLRDILSLELNYGSFVVSGYFKFSLRRGKSKSAVLVFNSKDYRLAQEVKETLDELTGRGVTTALKPAHQS